MADELFRLTVITYRVVRLGNSMRFTLVAVHMAYGLNVKSLYTLGASWSVVCKLREFEIRINIFHL